MKFVKSLLPTSAALLLNAAAFAHEGHGVPGTVGHDLQHQLWNFAGLIVLGAILLAGDQVLTLARRSINRRRRNEERDE